MINKSENKNKKNSENSNKEKDMMTKKISNPINKLKSKSLSKSIKEIPDKLRCSVELPQSKIIYENGVSDDEDEIKKIKKRKKKKIIKARKWSYFSKKFIKT